MCCWDALPIELKFYIIEQLHEIYVNAVKKIQYKWINYNIPKKVATLLAKEQINPRMEKNWYYVLDIRLVKYLEYFAKFTTGSESNDIWVPFLNYIQDDLDLYDELHLTDENHIRSNNAYKILRKKFGYHKFNNNFINYTMAYYTEYYDI